MFRSALVAGAAVAGTALMVTAALGHSDSAYRPLPPTAAWTTLFKAPVGIEGLTGDGRGQLYTAGRETAGSCPVYRVRVSGGPATVVGTITAPCGPAGLAFGRDGRLYIGDSGRVMVLRPSAASPPVATVFASGVPGANGLAFDRRGTLWVSDGATAQGRVWRVSQSGAVVEAFRVQPMANDAQPGGVGRDPRGLPPGEITITPTGRQASNTAGSQHIVANGLAFDRDGTLYVADTARGAIWRVRLDRDGRVLSRMGCDTTFPETDTLCLDNVFTEHPYLEGADGIALDKDGNIIVAPNERNAIAVVTEDGHNVELFRNPVTARLRNQGPLEFPTSPFIDGRTLCVTNSDGGRRDNFPSSGGETDPATTERAKVNCLDERLPEKGLELPVR
jgi:sugar lactone lactonase YvrE